MSLSRRTFLTSSMGVALSTAFGCASSSSTYSYPGARWPQHSGRPVPGGSRVVYPPGSSVNQARIGQLAIHRRSEWTTAQPIAHKTNPMNGISRITVHHEGSTPVRFTDRSNTMQRLAQVYRAHVNGNGWGDVGYHYIVDRAGEVWEARPISLQGAHASQQNPHNVGVMLLGNFEQQHPSQAQLNSLARVLQELKRQYRVPRNQVFTHREIGRTLCPGRNLQPRVDTIRRTL